MASPTEENFGDYKKAEARALAIVAEMKGVSAKKTDIELALLVSVFELHKGELPAEQIASIINGHLNTLVDYYAPRAQ